MTNLYTIEDVEACQCSAPFAANNDAVAQRQFTQLVKKEAPEYLLRLLRVASFENATGEVFAEQPVQIMSSTDVVVEVSK